VQNSGTTVKDISGTQRNPLMIDSARIFTRTKLRVLSQNKRLIYSSLFTINGSVKLEKKKRKKEKK